MGLDFDIWSRSREDTEQFSFRKKARKWAGNKPSAAGGHLVQRSVIFLCLESCHILLLSNILHFVPCDLQPISRKILSENRKCLDSRALPRKLRIYSRN